MQDTLKPQRRNTAIIQKMKIRENCEYNKLLETPQQKKNNKYLQ